MTGISNPREKSCKCTDTLSVWTRFTLGVGLHPRYSRLVGFEGAICHSGDDRTGEGDGDDETLTFDLSRIPPGVEKLAVWQQFSIIKHLQDQYFVAATLDSKDFKCYYKTLYQQNIYWNRGL